MLRNYHSVGSLGLVSLISVMLVGCSSLSEPLNEQQIASYANHFSEAIPLTTPVPRMLTMDMAVDRAVNFNQTIRAKEYEAMLALAKADALQGAMLPSLVAKADYYRRNSTALSRSSQSSTYSTSSERGNLSGDIALSWNILDFGLSYIRARQGLDRVYQQREEARKVKIRIVEETRSLYWRAVALQRIDLSLPGIEKDIESAIRVSQNARNDIDIDPMLPINYQRDTLTLLRELNQLRTSLAGSNDQLKISIGANPESKLRLQAAVDFKLPEKPRKSAKEDVSIALKQRPEMRSHFYDLRISEDDAHVAILQALPGATILARLNGDSNAFLLNANWISMSASIAGNLINLLRLPAELDSVEAQKEAHRQNAIATAATIAMQVHVARARMSVQLKAYQDANRFGRLQRDIMKQVNATALTGKAAQHAIVRERLATLLSDIRIVVAYADLISAHASYLSARGEELFPVKYLPHPNNTPLVDIKSDLQALAPAPTINYQ